MNEYRGRILFIAYYFPPASTSGVFRSLGFIRHLCRMGWKVQVLTATQNSISSKDYKLLAQVPPEVEIIEAPVIDLFRAWAKIKKGISFSKSKINDETLPAQGVQVEGNDNTFKNNITHLLKTPDSWIGWFFPSLLKTLRIEKPDIIYSSAPPFTGHLIALSLKKRWEVPFICDFRDPWIDNPFRIVRPNIAERRDRNLEKLVFNSADTIIANTKRMADVLATSHPEMRDRISVITNGFDPEDFCEITTCREAPISQFLLLHLGSLYGNRNPLNFLLGVKQAIYDYGCDQIKIQLIGANESISGRSLVDLIYSFGLSEYVDVIPSVPHSHAMSRMKGADMLLLFSQGTKIQVPAKIYEYMGLKKRIFAVCDSNSATKDIMDELGGEHCCSINKVEEITKNLRDVYVHWQRSEEGFSSLSDSNTTGFFQREHLTRQLETLMFASLEQKGR